MGSLLCPKAAAARLFLQQPNPCSPRTSPSILAFDGAAAARYGEIITTRSRAGKPIEAFDALIAATALVAGAHVATRDISGFQGLGLALIDPWGAR